jgi:hypothetical protein
MRIARASRWIVASGLVVACSSHEHPTVTQRSHSPTPSPVPAVSAPASTRDEAFALAVAHAEQTHPGVTFSLVEETQGGGRSGPWVFQLSAPAPPLLVQYKSANVIEIAPNANGLRAAVYAWEVQTYGHGQK